VGGHENRQGTLPSLLLFMIWSKRHIIEEEEYKKMWCSTFLTPGK
jgi:hypothetical protein